MNNVVEIECKDLCVEFPLFDQASRSMKARLGGKVSEVKTFKALKRISVKIHSGERVGLLGRNGAGKSTFLRTLAGVYIPKSGILSVGAATTSLFEVAVGTSPDASGYENIPLLMASRGIPSSQINEVIADVEEFTELGDALSRPLRTYSQGMKLRIAFSVATFNSEDILLMDEVVGVGDRSFRTKSKIRLENLMSKASTFLLASHSNDLLKNHCERGLVFDNGKITFDGTIDEAVEFHQQI